MRKIAAMIEHRREPRKRLFKGGVARRRFLLRARCSFPINGRETRIGYRTVPVRVRRVGQVLSAPRASTPHHLGEIIQACAAEYDRLSGAVGPGDLHELVVEP